MKYLMLIQVILLNYLGKVNNKGLEISLSMNLLKKDFNLNLGLTFTKNKNSIISMVKMKMVIVEG
jgi:hypothetical protein